MNLLNRRGKPPLSKDLLDFLNRTYPDVLPRSNSITLEELARLQGQRSVVDFLTQLYEQEE